METLTAVPAPQPFSTPFNIRKYRHEDTLFVMLAITAVLILGTLTAVTMGTVWIFLAWLYLMYLTVASYFICYLRGNAVKVGADQFPELHTRFRACAAVAGINKLPDLYLLSGDGMLNAFAARFLNRYYVVLLSDVVDALEEDEEAINFYMGHELGHIAQKHLARMWWVRIAMGIPLLGAAYSRAREYTCDQYGLACCASTKSAVHALSVLAAGTRRWKSMNKTAFIAQGAESGGFWMALNELTADYPWLCKRVARLQSGDEAQFPRRHAMAWFFAAFVPRTGMGLAGAAILYSYLLVIVISLVIGANSLLGKVFGPSSPNMGAVFQVAMAHQEALVAAAKVDVFIDEEDHAPQSLQETSYELPSVPPFKSLALTVDEAPKLTVKMDAPIETVSFTLTRTVSDSNAAPAWTCKGGPGVDKELLPEGCQP